MDTTTDLKKQGNDQLTAAQTLTVTSETSYRAAAEAKLAIRDLRKQVEATFKPIKQAQDAAKRQTLATERSFLDPLEQADTLIEQKMLAYKREQEEQVKQLAVSSESLAKVTPLVPKVAGIVHRKTWAVEVMDLRVLVLAVGAGEMVDYLHAMRHQFQPNELIIIREFLDRFSPAVNSLYALQPDEVAIRKTVTMQQQQFRLAGVKTKQVESL